MKDQLLEQKNYNKNVTKENKKPKSILVNDQANRFERTSEQCLLRRSSVEVDAARSDSVLLKI